MDRQLRLISPICRLLPPNSQTLPIKAKERRSRRTTRGTTRSTTHSSGLYSMEKSWLKRIVPTATMKTRSPLAARLQRDEDCLFDCAGMTVLIYFDLVYFRSVPTSCLTTFSESYIFGPHRLSTVLVVRLERI